MGYIRFDGDEHHKLEIPGYGIVNGGEVKKLPKKVIEKLLADPNISVQEVKIQIITTEIPMKDDLKEAIKKEDKPKSEAKSEGQKTKEVSK